MESRRGDKAPKVHIFVDGVKAATQTVEGILFRRGKVAFDGINWKKYNDPLLAERICCLESCLARGTWMVKVTTAIPSHGLKVHQIDNLIREGMF